jgi:hypothetical protein
VACTRTATSNWNFGTLTVDRILQEIRRYHAHWNLGLITDDQARIQEFLVERDAMNEEK